MAAEIEESLRTYLLTLEAVTALVGTGDSARIRPDRLHQDEDLPAVVIEVDYEDHLNDLDGKGGLVYADVNVKCRAETKAVSRQLAEAIRTNDTDPGTGLAGYTGTAGDQTIGAVLEDETTGFRPAGDGSDRGYYDTDMSFMISYNEDV